MKLEGSWNEFSFHPNHFLDRKSLALLDFPFQEPIFSFNYVRWCKRDYTQLIVLQKAWVNGWLVPCKDILWSHLIKLWWVGRAWWPYSRCHQTTYHSILSCSPLRKCCFCGTCHVKYILSKSFTQLSYAVLSYLINRNAKVVFTNKK